MLEIDGQAGGGQIVRTAVSLAALSGRPIRVTNVRGSRSTPGLRAQHLTAIEAAATVCHAETTGVDPESTRFEFDPGPLEGGRYCLDVVTAGSVALVFETLLPLAFTLDSPLEVTVRGGTDVRWAPPMAYYREAKLALLREHGLLSSVAVDRPGFYPTGGGVATLQLAPSTPSPIRLPERGAIEGVRVRSLAADALREKEVAARSLRSAIDALPDVPVRQRTTEYADADCPGSAVVATVDCEAGRAGFSALGDPGTAAEAVGEAVADGVKSFVANGAPVDEHLADQLVVPLALSGGRVRIPRVTDHIETNVATVNAFGYDVSLERTNGRTMLVAERP